MVFVSTFDDINKLTQMENAVLFTAISADSLKAMIAEVVKESLTKVKAENTPLKDDAEKVLEASDVIRLLKISPATLQNWKLQGKIPFYRIGRRIFFKESEVLKSLNKAQL